MPTKTDDRNEYKAQAEIRHAHKLARHLHRNRISVDDAQRWTNGQWLSAAVGAGIVTAKRDGKVPNERTRGIAVGLLAGRYRHNS